MASPSHLGLLGSPIVVVESASNQHFSTISFLVLGIIGPMISLDYCYYVPLMVHFFTFMSFIATGSSNENTCLLQCPFLLAAFVCCAEWENSTLFQNPLAENLFPAIRDNTADFRVAAATTFGRSCDHFWSQLRPKVLLCVF